MLGGRRSICPDEWLAKWEELRANGAWFGELLRRMLCCTCGDDVAPTPGPCLTTGWLKERWEGVRASQR